MKKTLLITIILLTFGMMSCKQSASAESQSTSAESFTHIGTWVLNPGETKELGFILNEGGSAISLNSSDFNFDSWEKNGDMLVLKGHSYDRLGNRSDFADTMKINSISQGQLILSQAGDTIVYTRK